MKSRFFFQALWLLFGMNCMIAFVSSCRSNNHQYEPTYSRDTSAQKILLFGVPSQSYYEVTSPFVNYLNRYLKDVQVQAVASSSFLGYNDKLDQRYYDFTIVSGVQALKSARNGYTITGQAVDEQGNSGAILVHKDSAINSIGDMRGRTIATPGFPALPGHMLQMIFLGRNGIDVKKEIRTRYVESFESVYLNVYLGKCSAGFSTTTRWKSFIKVRPEIASKLVLKWETPPVIGNALVVRNDLDVETANQLNKLILSMHTTWTGKEALEKIGFMRFDAADSNSYQPVKDFLREYETRVGMQRQ